MSDFIAVRVVELGSELRRGWWRGGIGVVMSERHLGVIFMR